MPMTKAVVRAMDTIQDFARRKSLPVPEQFMVAGASKRGWTTWTTAAVDKRVITAVPIVMDLLSMNKALHSHFRALGGWTFAFNDYYSENITKYVDTPELQAMARIIDPLSYLDRFRDKNLLVVTTSGDEFFLPQDTHNYWSDLVAATNGAVLLRRVPNAEHSCAGHEMSLFFSLRSYFLYTYDKVTLPKVIWNIDNNQTHGVIKISVDTSGNRPKPVEVRTWYTQTLDSNRIDFRLVIGDPNKPGGAIPHPVVWKSTKKYITSQETSTSINYQSSFIRPLPNTFWFAFFVQFSFPGPDNSILVVTTETNIIPETWAFPDCYRESCYGSLV
jgi:PhoPQ-activated pathogenicity-related protein